MNKSLIIVLLFICSSVFAQHTNYHLGKEINAITEKYLEQTNAHTSFYPLVKTTINQYINFDSIYNVEFPYSSDNWYKRKVFAEHLIILEGEDFRVTASPIIHFSKGYERNEKKNTFTNTRGFVIEGDIGNTVSFYSSFAENQAVFPNYLDSSIQKSLVVPGQGYARGFKETGFDYAMSSGYVSVKPAKQFTIQFGHGKHFVGNGYRSLLLSDNTFNYPYLRLQTNFWKVQYTNLYAEFQDINYFNTNGIDNYDQMGYAKKYLSSHHLSININKKWNLSLYEAIIWRANHAPGSGGFDVNYLNPIIMFRPVEFSINSPDNALVGVHTKYKLPFKSYVYGQLILDEFNIGEMRSGNNWWGNKYGYQIGAKMHDAIGVENLSLQLEYNLVRPYTYAHYNPMQNYAHYNQPLAHPLGANFSECLFIAHYRLKRWVARAQIMTAKYGGKIKNNPTSWGNDVYMSTGNYAEIEEVNVSVVGSGRNDDFGIEMYQGNLTSLNFVQLNFAYIVNPKTHLKIDLGIISRTLKNDDGKQETLLYSCGLKSDLFNQYYDF